MKESAPLILFAMMMQNQYRESNIFSELYKKELFKIIPKTMNEGEIINHKEDTNYNWVKITEKTVIIKKINNSSGKVKLKNNNKEYSPEEAINKIFKNGFEFYSYSSNDFVEFAEISINKIPSPYKLFTVVTDGYWKDLEVEKTKIMVLSIPNGTFVRSANKPKEELSASDVNGKFLTLDGLLYKSKNAQTPIVYMEV